MAKDLDLNQEIDDLFEPTQVEKNVQFAHGENIVIL